MSGMGSHQSAKSLKEEWLTPPYILEAVGPFDLDPCSPDVRPWAMAENHYTIFDDGLKKQWCGMVWLNPPYGEKAGRWLSRLAEHGNGIALTFARTETAWFYEEIWCKADALFFLKGRLHFHHVNGVRAKSNAGAPSVLVAYGKEAVDRLSNSDLDGVFVPTNINRNHP